MSSRLKLTALLCWFFTAAAFLPTVQATEPVTTAEAVMKHPFLSPIFGDKMVLQRNKLNTFWGWSAPGHAVTVSIEGKSYRGRAEDDGRWEVRFTPPAAGGPYQLKVSGDQVVELKDILVGDVWLCGGQSNMLFSLAGARNGADEVKAANHPKIRFFLVQQQVAYAAAAIPRGEWRVCSPETAGQNGFGGLSAVAYYFARKVQSEVDIPIGLVEDCVGGTPVEVWMKPETLAQFPATKTQVKELQRLTKENAPPYGNYISHWYDQYDIGMKDQPWFTPEFNDQSWKNVSLSTGFAEFNLADHPAVIWFRKKLTLTSAEAERKASIALGSVEKMDTVFINGQWVGASSWVENPRHYTIQDHVLKAGENVIAIRVFKLKSKNAFLNKPADFKLELGDNRTIGLDEGWKAAVSVDAGNSHPLPLGYENYPTMPSVLYRGMIAPIAPLALTGALWYQGEANWQNAPEYGALLTGLISDWRTVFKQGDFPFYIVSLPAFMKHKATPRPDGWTGVRAAQIEVGMNTPHSGVAITVDTGDADNIHPKDKLAVGERLALVALAQTYHQAVPFEGPTYDSMETRHGALRIHFKNAEGLFGKGGKTEEFAIAGADRKWAWADVAIDGETVVLSAKDVPAPTMASYAWQGNPRATMYNRAQLPMVPFNTDSKK